ACFWLWPASSATTTMWGRGSAIPNLKDHAVGAQRAGDVLQILLAHVVDCDVELAANLLVGGGRQADPARLGNGFQARGDVDRIAEDVIAFGQHVADIDADPEAEPLLGRLVGGRRHAPPDPARAPA